MEGKTVERLRLMIVAGEDSGDAHAASLVCALRERAPGVGFELFGSTGEQMRVVGVESVIREDDLAITGLLEIALSLPRFANAYRALKRAARKRRPDAVVLVDWPDFNLPLARALHRQGFHVIYYISPQLWAWRAGSRRKELQRILPVMLDAAARLSQTHASAQFVVALGSRHSPAEVEQFIAAANSSSLAANLRVTQYETREALAAADVAAVASGTATLEAALIATPLVVVYKESALNWHTLGRLINVEHYGLVNLIAGERLVPELMQNDFTGESLARELSALLEPARNAAVRDALRAATAQLGEGGASLRAADVMLRAIRHWKWSGE
ncbi:MAG: hypothetical protein LC754_05550 [Acidobacteria bacterium]|nr:hypothetical protein [Acidobacteriota bacterium]